MIKIFKRIVNIFASSEVTGGVDITEGPIKTNIKPKRDTPAPTKPPKLGEDDCHCRSIVIQSGDLM